MHSLTHLECGFNLVGERSPPDWLTTLSGTSWVACLDHEALYVSMEFTTIVGAAGSKSKEVFRSLRCRLTEQLDFDITVGCVKGDRLDKMGGKYKVYKL